MNTHDLAHKLLALPNLPAVINGYGDDEGGLVEVSSIEELEAKFLATGDYTEKPGSVVVIDL